MAAPDRPFGEFAEIAANDAVDLTWTKTQIIGGLFLSALELNDFEKIDFFERLASGITEEKLSYEEARCAIALAYQATLREEGRPLCIEDIMGIAGIFMANAIEKLRLSTANEINAAYSDARIIRRTMSHRDYEEQRALSIG